MHNQSERDNSLQRIQKKVKEEEEPPTEKQEEVSEEFKDKLSIINDIFQSPRNSQNEEKKEENSDSGIPLIQLVDIKD